MTNSASPRTWSDALKAQTLKAIVGRDVLAVRDGKSISSTYPLRLLPADSNLSHSNRLADGRSFC